MLVSRAFDMTIIHAQLIDGQEVLPKADFDRLLELARKNEAVVVQSSPDAEELSPMLAAIQGGAFDFWNDPEEDLYSSEVDEAK
jgi:hypothetical protein